MAQQWIATRPGGLEVFELQEAEVPPPGPGEVTVAVRAAGVNPADLKHVRNGDPGSFPRPVGYEVAGVLTALGPGAEIATGGGAVGDAVVAYRVRGGWASELTVPAADVLAKPTSLGFPEAANLLLAGATAAEMLHVVDAAAGDTVVVHGASGAVGVSLLQQARLLGVRVVGTASPARFDEVRRFGGEPAAYGDGLLDAVRAAAPEGVVATLDCVGTDEALDVSLALVPDRDRVVTIAGQERGRREGVHVLGGTQPASAAYRDAVRSRLVDLAGSGDLVVPVVGTYALSDAMAAAERILTGHPGGKLALVPDRS